MARWQSSETGRPRTEQRERAFFADRVDERDRLLSEVLGTYDHISEAIAHDYGLGTDWLATNPRGFNKGDLTDAVTAASADAVKIMTTAQEALGTILSDSLELRSDIEGDDQKLLTVLLDHASKPNIGSSHESVREGFNHFSSVTAKRTAQAVFDDMRLQEIKSMMGHPGVNFGELQRKARGFSTPASQLAADAFLDAHRLNLIIAQAGTNTAAAIDKRLLESFSTRSIGVLADIALDATRLVKAEAVTAQSQLLGLEGALASMYIESMSCQPVKDMAYSITSRHFTPRQPGLGERQRTTWLPNGWEASDPWGHQQRQRARTYQSSSYSGSRRASSSGSDSSQSRSGRSSHSSRTKQGQERPEQQQTSSAERQYNIGPNREPATPEELDAAQRIKEIVTRYDRKFSWFRNEDPQIVVDVMRAVSNIRATKGNEGIRDRTVYIQIRRLSEQQHNNPSHPAHTWVTYLDAMLKGKLGKDSKLPF